MNKIYHICLVGSILLLSNAFCFSQITGGRNTYDFLNLSYSARNTGLGNAAIAIYDNDISLVHQNPAALNSSMHKSVSVQQSVYFAGITHGLAAYAHQIKDKPFMLYGGIQYVSYGNFVRTNNIGETQGNFGASEFALSAAFSYEATDRWSFGSQQKIILSYLEGYNSVGWASDWAMMYRDTSKKIVVSFVLKNAGTQISTYNRDKNFQTLPFDAQLGFSHKLKYLPLRFSVIAHHLHQWNLLYDDPALAEQNILGGAVEETNTAGKVVDNIFRHFIFNIELLLGKKEVFRLRLGYDRMRQGEMNVNGLRGMAGFSTGLGIRVYKFNVDYGLSIHHLGGIMHHFGISTRFTDF